MDSKFMNWFIFHYVSITEFLAISLLVFKLLKTQFALNGNTLMSDENPENLDPN